MSEANMKSENKETPVQNTDLTDDQIRDEATRNFLHPENKPKIKQKSWFRRNLGRLLVAGALVAGGTGFGIYENAKSHEPIPIPATFDPSALKSVIGVNNSVQMTFDEYSAVAPPIWEEQGEVMTIPVPVVFHDGRNPTLRITKMQNQIIDSMDIIDINGLEQGDIIVQSEHR
jgi:hypothetical protein